jgi:hypothetical protein
MSDKKEKRIVAIQLDQAEIAVRIVEALTDSHRPDHMPAREALDMMTDSNREGLFQASKAVAEYFFEQIVASGLEDAKFLNKGPIGRAN